MLAALIFVGVFVTSILSGLTGMAGGVVLLALLILTLPTSSAMILHGVIQAMANGSRVWFIRDHMLWRLMPMYFAGVVLIGILFWVTQISWSAPVILIAIGFIAWLPVLLPERLGLDITKQPVALLCGITVTAAQLLAGTSGPLLDVFFQKSKLSRFEIVATKAFTQAVGHIVKVIYFFWLSLTRSDQLHELVNILFILVLLTVSLFGTKLGTLLLHRIDESNFRRMTTVIILILGTLVGLGGTVQLITGKSFLGSL